MSPLAAFAPKFCWLDRPRGDRVMTLCAPALRAICAVLSEFPCATTTSISCTGGLH
eukprot:CAMPEP_0119199610 /NCGR_PEP_ID=MMETSP1316-20130426/23268_1 /TAXON_ID=41880 /ORGANISM="Pycnococcus provasolii, Strain RCC2336" /LENGTH=55 /DNA_ID=CAMNT_0007195621 /DNA_START=183 /DNA_END=347 /DNA_ORIENTATION=-